jgi:hypothetical protein
MTYSSSLWLIKCINASGANRQAVAPRHHSPLVRIARRTLRSFVSSLPNTIERLSENEAAAFLASIVESHDSAIFGLNLDGTVVSWNKAAE